MTRRTLQERYQLDDEECPPVKRNYGHQCPVCNEFGRHHFNCPNAPDEPEQEEDVPGVYPGYGPASQT